MNGFLYTIFAFVVAIAILVVVHEFGHYWVAKHLGVKVLRFSVGFGRPLWMRRFGRDRTEFVIAAIPLGGYVKMLDENEGRVPVRERKRAFNRQPLWKRSLIVLAGPAFNLLFAVLIYATVNLVGTEGLRPLIGRVAAGSLAEQGGFRAGDEMLRVDGRGVQSWDERRLYFYEKALDRAQVRIAVRDADGLQQERTLDFSSVSAAKVGAGLLEREVGLSPSLPTIDPILGTVEADTVAAKAGLQPGDRIVAIDGRKVATWAEAVTAISARPGELMRIGIERGGLESQIEIRPEPVTVGEKRIGRIGVGVRIPEIPASMRVVVHYPPWSALSEATETTWRMSALTLKLLSKMVQLEVSAKTISGPITIAQYAGASARIGFDRFVLFLAVISISLGVLNLLPIPVLDGGHLVLYAIESVRGKPLSERALHLAQQAGLMLLVMLMLLAFYNDLTRILQ